MNYQFLLAFLLSFGLVVGLTPLVRLAALKWGIIDVPDEPRKIQKGPVPGGGGAGVFLGFAFTALLWLLFSPGSFGMHISTNYVWGLLAGGVILVVGGLLDDKFRLPPRLSIISPVLAVLAVIFSGVQLSYINNPLGGAIVLDTIKIWGYPLMGGLFIFFWILGMIYTTKFLDGMDGLVSGVVGIGAVVVFLVSLLPDVRQPDTALLAIIFAGSILGFLPWNFHPAKIFLGEGGSTLAGFLLGTLAVISGGKIATALLVMGIPILDAAWVILRRVWNHFSPFKADRKHLHFRLLDLGFSQRQTVLFLYAISLTFGATTFFLQSRGKLVALLVLLVFMVVLGTVLVIAYSRKHGVETKKIFIQNRKGQRVAVMVELPAKPSGLGFVMHGLSAFKEQSGVRAIAKAFVKNHLITVTFDTTNTLGESDGNFELATATGYYEDLEDVIAWAASRSWYREPFFLAGSSLGGLCSLLFAEKYPQKVKGLVPVASSISGHWTMAGKTKEHLESWQKSGWLVEPSRSRPGVIKRLSWNYMEDLQKYDALKEVSKLSMPSLVIACGNDTEAKHESLKLLFEQLPGKKEFQIIKDAPHTIRDSKQLEVLEGLVSDWIAGQS